MIRLRSAALALVVGLLVLLSGCGNDNPPYNDTPIITSLFPSSATAGGPGFTLNVSGTGFISTSVVYWNNSARTTTYNTTSTQLSISVTAQDIASPGTAQVVVVTPAPGGGASTAASFTITPAQNPVPAITSLSPSSTPVGVVPSGGLTVTGTNFVSNSSAVFNGNLRPTNFVSATQLTVPMSASDVAANATINVTVSNPAPGGGVSGSLPFKVGTGGAVHQKASVAAVGSQFPQLVSASAAGGASNGASGAPAISSDGRFIAFVSTATNLVAQGASGSVFVRDTCLNAANCTPETLAVDLAPDGSAPNAAAEGQAAISGDGRFVAFASSATNLIPSPPPINSSQTYVYIRDLCLGSDAPVGCAPRTELVSLNYPIGPGVASGASPSLSADGRFVAFISGAIVERGFPGNGLYVRDRCTGATGTPACGPYTYALPSSNGGASPEIVAAPVISPDGRYVAFEATSISASASTDQSAAQVFLTDTCLGPSASSVCVPSTSQVSVSADDSALLGVNQAPSISADARFIAFESSVPGAAPNVFLRDTCLGVIAGCVPSTTLLIQNAAASYISSNGRYVSFIASPTAAPASGAVGTGSLYVYDTCFGAAGACTPQSYPITAASVGSGSSPLTVNASPAPLTSDSGFLVFSSSATIAGLPLSGYGDVLLNASPF